MFPVKLRKWEEKKQKRFNDLVCVTNLEQRDLSTFWSFRKLWNAIHPGHPHLSKGFRSVHLFHGLPHPRAPVGDVADRFSCQQKPMVTYHARRHQAEKIQHHLMIITIIELKVLFRDKGIGPPYNHLRDQVGIHGCGNQSCDSSIAPSQQRELFKPQSLPEKIEKKSQVSCKIRCK